MKTLSCCSELPLELYKWTEGKWMISNGGCVMVEKGTDTEKMIAHQN
jgi:hypothetical protein